MTWIKKNVTSIFKMLPFFSKWHAIKPKNYIHKTKDFKREKSKDQKLNANMWYSHKKFIGTFIKINMCLIADENKNIILPRETHISSYTVSCKVTANHSLKDSLRLIKT